jgi:hypothetical protein
LKDAFGKTFLFTTHIQVKQTDVDCVFHFGGYKTASNRAANLAVTKKRYRSTASPW